jgi:polyisoprenoid-binding protein YceI
MKKAIILTGALVVLTLMAFKNREVHTEVYKVDTKASTLEWYAEKVSGKHNGVIQLLSGDIKNDHGNLSGTFEIDMNSIEDKDMEPGKGKTKLETHLKSADFFDAAKFPTSKFVITSVAPLTGVKAGGPNFTVKGLLTIKDKTNEISFDALIKLEQNKLSCAGSAIVDRSKFDIKYGSKTFFADIGDKMINDEFTIKLNVVAVK